MLNKQQSSIMVKYNSRYMFYATEMTDPLQKGVL